MDYWSNFHCRKGALIFNALMHHVRLNSGTRNLASTKYTHHSMVRNKFCYLEPYGRQTGGEMDRHTFL